MSEKLFYSRSTRGFYNTEIHGSDIPEDAVEISQERYQSLIIGQIDGKIIECDASGVPYLSDRLPLTVDELLLITASDRQKAYRDEADPLFFKAQRGEATVEEWLAKIAEIKERYPKPTQE